MEQALETIRNANLEEIYILRGAVFDRLDEIYRQRVQGEE